MTRVITITGSPSPDSRTGQLAATVSGRLRDAGLEVDTLAVRDLPPEDVFYGRADSAAIREAAARVAEAHGVVVATPIYKAAYTGILKAFLDLLPQYGLAGKVVLPLATGGSLAHVLALDYALRPVLSAMGAQHVVSGLFILDKLLVRQADGGLAIETEIAQRLDGVLGEFIASVRLHNPAR